MDYARMLDKAHRPTEAEILATIGHTAAWLDLRQYIEARYGDWTPELKFFARRYGWTIRYRKSGKTLSGQLCQSQLKPATGEIPGGLKAAFRDRESSQLLSSGSAYHRPSSSSASRPISSIPRRDR